MPPRKIIDAVADKKGNITKIKLDGNSKFTSLKTAMKMADQGDISNAYSVNRRGAKPHLRTNPDPQKSNNLDNMAGDT